MALSPGSRLGPYEILAPIGAGGMGEVYRAKDPRLGREVAIKVLPASFSADPDRLRRFEQEARAAGILNHPNVTAVYDIGKDEHTGAPYVVQELLEGETLRQALAGGQVSARNAIDYATQIALGLAAAHEKGVVHRDLKPENLFVGRDGHVKILDFGLARVEPRVLPGEETGAPTVSGHTEPGVVMGTVGYMSPEQVRGKPADARSDVFSFGAVLYEMLTGRRAFQKETGIETLTAILKEEPELTGEAGSISPALNRVVRHCLEKNPEERFQSARDIAFALTEASSSVSPVRLPAADVGARAPRSRLFRSFLWAAAVIAFAAAVLLFRPHAGTIDSLAVLPFVNVGHDPNADYLSDGITESLIDSVSQIPGVKVVSRGSAFYYKGKEVGAKDIGKQLGVRAVLTGRIVQHGDTLSIRAELVDARDDTHLWGEEYNRKLADILALQEEIARDISGKLRQRLTGEQKRGLSRRATEDPEAYGFYLKGRYHWNKRTGEDLQKGITYFQQAIDRDPTYALAYAGLADCYALLFLYGGLPSAETFPKAKAAALKALEIDETLAQAHAVLAYTDEVFSWDYSAAEKEYRRGIELDPKYPTVHHWYSLFLSRLGRHEQAIAEAARAYELDPLSPIISNNRAVAFVRSQQSDRAIEAARQTLELDSGFSSAHLWLGLAFEQKKMYAEATASLEEAVRLSRRSIVTIADLGHVNAVSGKREEAMRRIEELKGWMERGYDPLANIAMVYAGLGQNDDAIEWLEKACRARSAWVVYLAVKSTRAGTRSDPIRGSRTCCAAPAIHPQRRIRTTSTMPISPGSRLGPYEILAPIGAGGMGEVWRARDPRLGRDVAIKVLPASFSADADRLRRFEQEARAAGILNHPNITAVLDIGEHESAPYVVQELLEGETLRQVLAGGRLAARKAIDFAIQIAHGLAAAHEKGIVHRDLKPENVFVTKDGRVKILDFGLAKLTHTEEGSQATNLPTATAGTEPGVVLGTLGYMSPEQVRGRSADARSDIFSFGAILYEMLAGQRAFRGDSAADTMSAILREDPADISVTNQNVPPGIERIVRHCLEKSPEQRFQSARDLAFDLESLSGVSTPSRPAAVPEEAPSRKRRAAIPLLVTVVALIAAGAYLAGARLRQGSRVDLDYQQLTFKHQPVFNARFAPDGRTLVFSSAPAGNATEIFTWRPDSPGVVSRGMKGVQLLSISSKGELAVLIKARYLRHRLFEGTLARMPLEGGAPREIADGIREADWAPDGTDLAISRNIGGRDRLEFPMGKVLAETGGYFSDLRFSPDGKRIAFFEHPIRFDDRGSVAVIDLAGRKTTLSDGYWAEEGLAWSADGREVIFSGGLGYNNFSVFAVDLAGRRRTALQSAGGLTILDVSKDRWAASRDDFFRDVLVMPPNGQHEKDLSWLELSYPVAFTPDGKTMLFTEESPSAGSLYSICIRGADGSPVVRLGEGNANDLSSDGKWALSVVPTNPDRLVMYPTGSGSARTIPSGGIVTYESAQFFPGAERVFFCGHESGKGVRCYVQGVGDAKPRAVTGEGTTLGWVSPDGKRLCVQTPEGLDVLPAEGGPARKVPGATADDTVIRWHPDGGGLLVARSWDVPLRVERLDLVTGNRTPFRTMGPPDLTGAIQILPVAIADDTRVYGYGARRMHSDLFLIRGAQ